MSGVREGLARVSEKRDRVRLALIYGNTRSLKRRRAIAGLSALALADAALVALNQMRALPRLPDPPLRIFDSNAVMRSRPAYIFGVPDAALATCNYAANLVFASAGGSARAGRSKLWSWALLANCLGGAIGAASYLADMLLRERRLCGYCLTAIGINFALLPLAWRELGEGR